MILQLVVRFGGAKAADIKKDKSCLIKDLMQIALFGKESINNNNLLATIFFKLLVSLSFKHLKNSMYGYLYLYDIGKRISFYVTSLKNDGLYLKMEFFTVEFPTFISDLSSFMNQFDDLLRE